jgi:phage terminase large subunit-like protein
MIGVVIAPQAGKQELAFNLKVDVLIYGGAAGSGKSRLLLMKPLQFKDDLDFQAIFFRKTTKALEKPGSLWPEGKKLYSPFKPSIRERDHKFTFNSGSAILMDYLEYDKDAEDNHQGAQYSMVGFDELTHFTQHQFTYLIGRLRSDSDTDSFCMATCNPDPDSWVLNWVEWYLDEEGYPDPEKTGKIRYYVVLEDKPLFADTKEELIEAYPELCYQENPVTGESVLVEPMSFAFVGGTIFDNPELIKKNPKYLANLKSQSKVNRARLLDGNWYARPEGSLNFQRDWLHKAEDSPKDCIEARAWDKAGTVPSDMNRYPDYTSCIKVLKDRSGRYFIRGDFCEENKDVEKTGDVYGHFRKRPGDRDRVIQEQARYDGDDCTVVLPQDPGSAGATEYQEAAKNMLEFGSLNDLSLKVRKDPMPTPKSKLKRYEPFASAAQNGLVSIVESSFPNKATLEAFYAENEAFSGERSTATRKDDWPDCLASGFNFLAKERIVRIPLRNQSSNATLAAPILADTVDITSLETLPNL